MARVFKQLPMSALLLGHFESCLSSSLLPIMPVTGLVQLPPFLLTTLGIFELSVVYSPGSETFHLTTLGNSQEAMRKFFFIYTNA